MTEFKPGCYETRLHKKAEVQHVSPHFLFGVAEDNQPCVWSHEGKFIAEDRPLGMHPLDLVGPWQEKPKPLVIDGWVNVTHYGLYGWLTKANADAAQLDRLDCRHLRYEQGKGITDITEEA